MPLRFVVLALLSVATATGCQNSDLEARVAALEAQSKGEASTTSVQSMQAAEDAARQADVAQLQSYCDNVVTAEQQARTDGDTLTLSDAKAYTDAAMKAVQMAAPAKLPHLIVDKTGEDLGIWLGYGELSLDPKTGLESSATYNTAVYFDGQNCTGNAAILVAFHSNHLYGSEQSGTLLKLNGPAGQFQSQSYFSNGACNNVMYTANMAPFVDTKRPWKRYDPADLRVELR